MVVIAFVLSILNYSHAESGCNVTEAQLQQIGDTVLCQRAEGPKACKEWVGLETEKKVAERMGMRIGSQTASSMWRGAINSSGADLRLANYFRPVHAELSKELEDQIAEYKRSKPQILEDGSRKEQIIFERRLQLLQETKYPDETFQKLANAYNAEKDPEKKAHWAQQIKEETFAKIENTQQGTSGFNKYQGRANLVEHQYEELEKYVKEGKELSLEDKKRFMDAGFRKAELDAINEHIALQKDTSKDQVLRRLLQKRKELSELGLRPGEIGVTPERANRLVELGEGISYRSETMAGKLSALKFFASPQVTGQISKRIGASALGPGVRWASEKMGSRAIGYAVAPEVQLAIDAGSVAAATISSTGTTKQDLNSKYLERTEDGGFVPGITPKTKEFLGLPWDKQKQEMDSDQMLCDKMKGLYKENVIPGWEIECTPDGFSANKPIGWASNSKVNGKVNPEGDLQEVTYEAQGLDRDSVPKGGFKLIYKDGSPEELRYHEFRDLGQSLKWRTGMLGRRESAGISNFNSDFESYPVGERLRSNMSVDRVAGTLNVAQKDQRFLVEAGSCCSSSRGDIGEERCRALGVKSGSKSSQGSSKAKSTR